MISHTGADSIRPFVSNEIGRAPSTVKDSTFARLLGAVDTNDVPLSAGFVGVGFELSLIHDVIKAGERFRD